MPARGGGGRSSGGGGGRGRVSGGGRHLGGMWGEYPAPRTVITPPPRSGGFKYIYDHQGGDPDAQTWYNSCSRRTRWRTALNYADQYCPDKPKGMKCQSYLELLVDAPPDVLRDLAEENFVKNKLPPLLYPDFPINYPPLNIRDPCYMWTTLLQKCRDRNTYFADKWKCVPFEGFVEDHCPGSCN